MFKIIAVDLALICNVDVVLITKIYIYIYENSDQLKKKSQAFWVSKKKIRRANFLK